MLIDTPPNCQISLRVLNGYDGTNFRQIMAHGVPVGFVHLEPGATIMMTARCTDDILDGIRRLVEDEIGSAAGMFTACPQMVDDERERCEAYDDEGDDDAKSPLWLPESFE